MRRWTFAEWPATAVVWYACAGLYASAAQAQAPARTPAPKRASARPAAATTDATAAWLKGGTLEFAINFTGSEGWARGEGSRDRSQASVRRSVHATVRLRGRTSPTNPIGDGVDVTLPSVGGATMAQLRRWILGKELQFDKAMALCGADAACNGELKRLVDQRMKSDMGSLAKPEPVVHPEARYVILEPASPDACDSARVTVGDGMGETRERADRRRDAMLPSWDRTWQGAWNWPETPALAAVCSAMLVLDLKNGVYQLTLPNAGRVRLDTDVMERGLSLDGERDFVRRDIREAVDVGGPAGAGFTFSNLTLPTLDEAAARLVGGRKLTSSSTLERVFTVKLPGHWRDGLAVPVKADVWWRYHETGD
jgi:hypothetical protein